MQSITTENLQALYYTTHVKNLASILDKGILSRNAAIDQGLYTPQNDISNPHIQKIRCNKNITSPRTGVPKPLSGYATTYLQPNNAFLLVIQENISPDLLCVIQISAKILRDKNDRAIVTKKNAACHDAKFFAPEAWIASPATATALTSTHLSGLESTQWVEQSKFLESKQKRQSEALFPEKINTIYFERILVNSTKTQRTIETLLDDVGYSIPVIIHPTLFPSTKVGAFNATLDKTVDPANPVNLNARLTDDLDAERKPTFKKARYYL